MSYKGTKRKRYGGKSKNLVKHFRRRMTERFQEDLSYSDIEYITQIIRRGETLRSRKQTNRVTEHVIKYNDKYLKVIYDKQRGLPVTCLYVPETYLSKYKNVREKNKEE